MVGNTTEKRFIIMKLKKIIFAVFCAAILLCTGVVCLASADDEGISTYGTSDLGDSVTYKGVTLRAQGFSSAPASITQIINQSTSKSDHFGEVDVSRYNTRQSKYEDTDGDNTIVAYGKTITGQIGQVRNNTYRYEHDAVLHIGTVSVSPIVETLHREYFF